MIYPDFIRFSWWKHLSFLALVASGFAQSPGSGYFMGSENLPLVTKPETAMAENFLYRIQEEKSSPVIYQIDLNSLLYSAKNAFLWPKQIPSSSINHTRFLTPSGQEIAEILFNNRLILSDKEKIVLDDGTSKVTLNQASRFGITQIKPSLPSRVQFLTRGIPAPDQPTPCFHYSLTPEKSYAVVRSLGHFSQILTLGIPRDSFLVIIPSLERLPVPNLVLDSFSFSVDSIQAESRRIQTLDSIILQISTQIQNDSAQLLANEKEIRERLSAVIPPFPFRDDLFESEVKSLVQQAAFMARAESILLTKKERLSLVKSLRDEFQGNRSGSAAFELRNRYLFGKTFFNVSGTIGKNLPSKATDPAPSKLLGVTTSLAYYHPLGRRLLLNPRLWTSYSQWQYHEKVDSLSRRFSGGAGIHLAIPLATGVEGLRGNRSGTIFLLRTGVEGGMSRTQINTVSLYSEKVKALINGIIGLDYFFTQLPMALQIEYSYDTQGYGDLRLGLTLPLPFFPKLVNREEIQ
jgi:hypothetical protein